MKRRHAALLLALTASSLASCESPRFAHGMPASDASSLGTRSDARVPAAMPTKGAITGTRSYGIPTRLAGHDVWLSSFVITKARSFFRDSDPFAEGGLAASASPQAQRANTTQLVERQLRWHNALFADRSNDEEWSLLTRRAFVSRWWSVVDFGSSGPTVRAMVFAVTLDDSNGDGYLDNRDAAVAVLTRGDGRGAKIVTPRDAQLNGVRFDPATNFLSFELRFDSDADEAFDRSDALRQYFLELGEKGLARDEGARPWHAPDAERALEALYR